MKIKLLGMCFVVGSALHAGRPINELPMYGGQHSPNVEQNRDHSQSAAKLGWEYFYKGDLDTAIKRFNQAWMFDRESVEAFWGFGLVMGRRAQKEDAEKNLRESIRCLEIAKAKAPKNGRILVDLAQSRTGLGVFLEQQGKTGKEEFAASHELYQAAVKLDPEYPLLYYNWAALDFYGGRYHEALQHLNRAKELGYRPDPTFEQELNQKLKTKREPAHPAKPSQSSGR